MSKNDWTCKTYYWSEAEYLKDQKIKARKSLQRYKKLFKLETQIFEIRKQILEEYIKDADKKVSALMTIGITKKRKKK